MDGFAVRSKDTEGASQTDPLTLNYGQQAIYVDTGDPIPNWANAVIMIENVESLDKKEMHSLDLRRPDLIRIRTAVPPWYHVRPMGEDMVATQLVLPAGHVIRPVDLGAIAGCGHESIKVARKPKVAIIPTGSELKKIGDAIRPGEIIEYNSLVMAAQINLWGGQAVRCSIVPDELERIQQSILDVLADVDLILLNAGSSAGSEDYSAKVVESLGTLFVHGVAVRPGHPVILGLINHLMDDSSHRNQRPKATPIIGVPGYPVSAALTGEIFVEPLIAKWLGRNPNIPIEMSATLTRKITSPSGDDDYVRVAVGAVAGKILAAPLSRGSGVISSLVRADGIVVIPSGSQGLPRGENVKVRMYRSPAEIQQTIFAIGSHDISLDVLAQFISRKGRRLISANMGSLGGLISLQRGEAHLAGSHLLDPDSGEYNLSYVKRYIPDKAVRIVALVGREQGLIIPIDNPKNINSLQDLIKEDIYFINRQRGAGTRVLLDYHLKKQGINADMIRGYEQEEFTHLAVAAAVKSGRADCGLGITAAAKALDLGFIPLFKERYDLVIPISFVEGELLAPLIHMLQDKTFISTIANLPGYDTDIMGNIIAELA
jgi:putative molybdopterin biosynthesis protein